MLRAILSDPDSKYHRVNFQVCFDLPFSLYEMQVGSKYYILFVFFIHLFTIVCWLMPFITNLSSSIQVAQLPTSFLFRTSPSFLSLTSSHPHLHVPLPPPLLTSFSNLPPFPPSTLSHTLTQSPPFLFSTHSSPFHSKLNFSTNRLSYNLTP